MAQFLNTRKAISEIEELIKTAGERLILISPYLRLSKDFKELLTYRNNKDKITTIIFREQALKIEELTFLEELRFVKLLSNESLHAKCYVNDEKMIITSLNLYEFSMANNKEMGVLISKDEDLYAESFKEVDFIKDTSVPFKYSTKSSSATVNSTTANKNEQHTKGETAGPSYKSLSVTAMSKEFRCLSQRFKFKVPRFEVAGKKG